MRRAAGYPVTHPGHYRIRANREVIHMTVNARRLLASVAFACGALVASQASAAITVQVLSSMPQLVTGGDALLRISGATAAPAVTVGGADVSAAFKADGAGNWIGLVTGLKDGDNALL